MITAETLARWERALREIANDLMPGKKPDLVALLAEIDDLENEILEERLEMARAEARAL